AQDDHVRCGMSARAGLRALPNIISSSRLLLAAGFVVTRDVDTRLGLVGLAAVTDVLDGWVARRGNWASRWGALIDPFADRVFVLVAVSTFLFTGALSTLGYFVMLSRDLMTAVGFLVARAVSWLRPVEFKARLSGKVVTVPTRHVRSVAPVPGLGHDRSLARGDRVGVFDR